MGKLVRDRIPEIIRRSGGRPVVAQLDEAGYRQALHAKLREEVGELLEASPAQRIEEAADVYEVLTAIVTEVGATMADVQQAAAVKRAERGGSERRLWLEG